MTLNEVNESYQKVSNLFYKSIQNKRAWYRAVDKELFFSSKHLIMANLKYFVRKKSMTTYELTDIDVEIKKTIEEALLLPSYSQNNLFVWLKRHMRLVEKYQKVHQMYIRDFDKMLNEIERLVKRIEETNSQKKTAQVLLQRLQNLEVDICAEKYGGDTEINDYTPEDIHCWLDLIVFPGFQIQKQQLLQLLTLHHTKETFEVTKKMPEILGYEDFETYLFVERIEDDQDCTFFRQYFKRFKKVMQENSELSEKLSMKTMEFMDSMITQQVTKKKQTPHLKLIQTKNTDIEK